MQTTTLKDDRANHGNDTEVMFRIAKSKIRDLIAEEVDHIYVERT